MWSEVRKIQILFSRHQSLSSRQNVIYRLFFMLCVYVGTAPTVHVLAISEKISHEICGSVPKLRLSLREGLKAVVLRDGICYQNSRLGLRGGFDLGFNDGFRQGSPSRMAVKRIQGEISALEQDPSPFFRASPLESDILNWHFVMLGANDTAFEGGFYHGQILLDQDYPMKPPRILFLTESGRFEIGEPICLSITSHHKETWQPSWDIRLVMTALQVREYKRACRWQLCRLTYASMSELHGDSFHGRHRRDRLSS
jgi:ubiquitin-protein ligase